MLMGSKVPHFKADIINLLRVVDMSKEDRNQLMKLGFSELENAKGTEKGADYKDSEPTLERERSDKLTASTFTLHVLMYETPSTAAESLIPRRFFVQVRFFTFPEVQTDVVQLENMDGKHGADIRLVNGVMY